MIALFRYTLATLLHSQRYVAPAFLFLALLAVLTSSDSGPLLPLYAVCAGSMFVCSTWLTVALVNTEDPVSRSIVVVNAGRSRGVLVAAVWVALAFCLVLTAVGLWYPLITGQHTVTAVALLLGAEAQLTCALVGITVGLLCSRLVIGRPGYSLVAAIAAVFPLLLVKWIPPVHPLLTLMGGDRPAGELVVPVSGYAAFGAAVLVAGIVITQRIADGRD